MPILVISPVCLLPRVKNKLTRLGVLAGDLDTRAPKSITVVFDNVLGNTVGDSHAVLAAGLERVLGNSGLDLECVGEVALVRNLADDDLEGLDDDAGDGGDELPDRSKAALEEGEARNNGGGGSSLATHLEV